MNNKPQARSKSATAPSQPNTKYQIPNTSSAKQSTVWKFTNKKELNKSQFIDYFERKIFRTIRKHNMLPKDKVITLKKSNDLNTTVLKRVIEKKFEVKFSNKPNLSSANLSQLAEDIFKQILKGNFTHTPISPYPHTPLLYLSDKEVMLYAKLTNTNGTKRKQDKKIQSLFDKFLKKNQDLELNVIKAIDQLN